MAESIPRGMTIAEAEASGFTHIEATCGVCTKITRMPFRFLHAQGHAVRSTRVAAVAGRLRCDRCEAPPASWRLWHDGMTKVPTIRRFGE
ncbi:MAG TPA: hypothetical protein VFX03_16805 [Thermomicrobiales bacterium]|nr:hypothetical protein [Thermomicrobiales bacterium]